MDRIVNEVYFFAHFFVVFSLMTKVTYTSEVGVLFLAPPEATLSICLTHSHSNTDEMNSMVTFVMHLLDDWSTENFSYFLSFVYFLFQECIFRSFVYFKTYHCYYYYSLLLSSSVIMYSRH